MFGADRFPPARKQFVRTPARGDESILLLAHLDGDALLDDGERILLLAGGDLVIVSGGPVLTPKLDCRSGNRGRCPRVWRSTLGCCRCRPPRWCTSRPQGSSAFSVCRNCWGRWPRHRHARNRPTFGRVESGAALKFLVSCLARIPPTASGPAPRHPGRGWLAHRICQKLEQQLADTDLTWRRSPGRGSVSASYLQSCSIHSKKVFFFFYPLSAPSPAGSCRFDLESRSSTSVDFDIGFRWVLTTPAISAGHFRDQFNSRRANIARTPCKTFEACCTRQSRLAA